MVCRAKSSERRGEYPSNLVKLSIARILATTHLSQNLSHQGNLSLGSLPSNEPRAIFSQPLSKTDQRKPTTFQHNWAVRTPRRNYARLRFGRNDCSNSADCLYRAQGILKRLPPHPRERVQPPMHDPRSATGKAEGTQPKNSVHRPAQHREHTHPMREDECTGLITTV